MADPDPGRRHYAWAVALACMAASAVALGFGRFALGMLLPSMGAALPLSYAEMGFISTGNFVGYLLGVLLVGRCVAALGERRTIGLSLAAIALSLAAVGRAGGFAEVLAFYTATGLFAGLANVAAVSSVTHWFARGLRGRASGVVVSGIGFATIFSGLAVPQINLIGGAEGWRAAWTALGLLSLAGAGFAAWTVRDRPASLGLRAAGHDLAASADDGGGAAEERHPGWRVVTYLGAAYFCFGATYSVYITFFVTGLVDERGMSEIEAGYFWAFFGLVSLVSGPLFGYLSDRIGRRRALATAFSVYTAAYALAAAELGTAGLWASVIIFGTASISVPAIMGAAVGDYAGPAQAVRVLSTITLFFACGQVVGPAAAGLLAETAGSFVPGYLGIAIIAAIGIILSLLIPPPGERPH